MKKELRRQIKQDEFATTLGHTIRWVESHAQEVKVTAAIVAVVGVGWLGLNYFRQSRAQTAEKAFAAALETFQAPVAGELAEGEAPPGRTVHTTAGEKFRKAAAEFAGLAQRYPTMPIGRRASYYEALCRLELGELAEAEKAFSALAARRDDQALQADLARLGLADVERKRGRVDQAVSLYRQMVDDATLAVPRDHVLMTLSSVLEEAGRLPEAGAAYRRLAQDFPTSVYAPEAQRRADYLQSDSPGQRS